MTTTAGDVWVGDYTTAAGVHVEGHWRRHNPTAGTQTGDHEPNNPDSGTTTVTRSTSLAGHGGSSADRVAAAEERYRSASVAAGLSALRQRRGITGDHHQALEERADARAALDVARQDLEVSGARCSGCGQFAGSGHQCPTPVGLPDADYSGLKKDERVKAMVTDLESSVKAIVESGQLHRWLDAMSSNGMTRWSANNRLLAALQVFQREGSLDNVHIMGFRQWEKFNRQVSKGAKAVWILAPVTRKVVDEDEAGDTTERNQVVGFKGVPVFNVSDTHGEPLPSAPLRSAAGAATTGTIEGLKDRVANAGYTYQEKKIPGCNPHKGEGTLGYTDPQNKQIVVDSRLDEAQKASTIAHELGHVHCGHVDGDYAEYQRHRGQMETEAETVAYLVNRSRGMTPDQVQAFSPGYIASWSKGDPGVIHKAIDKATRAHNKIIDGPWPDTGKES